MKIVIAIDSFKGSMSSIEAGNAAADGIRRVYPDAEVIVRPLADGGEGTVEALVAGCDGVMKTLTVTGPAGSPVECGYGIVEDTKTAIIEMSGAAGITQVSGKEKNPLHTTTYGVGEVIRHAIGEGCRNFIIGIGGSATNDGGIGMLQALGFGMLDAEGKQVGYGAEGAGRLAEITDTGVPPALRKCSFHIACDVTNPLCGELGCSAVYGPQKGATPEMVAIMDKYLASYATIAMKKYRDADPDYPGSGAAGGMGFAFRTFLNGELESGIRLVLKETKLRDYIKDADYVLTGEGRLDSQTVMGKAPVGVAGIAREYNIPVFAFAGSVAKDAAACNNAGINAFFPVLRRIVTLEEAMDPEAAKENMRDTVEQVFRVVKAGK